VIAKWVLRASKAHGRLPISPEPSSACRAIFSGDGFADMEFKVEALPKDAFSAWIEKTRKSAGATLTSQTYQDLAKQSMNAGLGIPFSIAEPARRNRGGSRCRC
jgi:hypothetical protein